MRDLNYHDGDSVTGALGPPIRPTAAPAAPREVRPGVFEGSDGKWHTKIQTDAEPKPAASAQPIASPSGLDTAL